jgi:invasion protein IalB
LLPYLRHGKAVSVRWPTAVARARKLDRAWPGMGEGDDGISQLWRDSLAFSTGGMPSARDRLMRFFKDHGRAAALIVALAVAHIAPASQALAQGAVKSVHKDWQIRCDTPPGAQGEQCALIQSVTAEDRANVGLTVIVLKTADQKSRLMRVVAPLGVLLPSGLGLKIDNADIGRAGFVRCLPNGCIAEVVMDDTLIGKLRNGKSATFIIFQTPEEGIGFPMSLNGFGEGYDKLP